MIKWVSHLWTHRNGEGSIPSISAKPIWFMTGQISINYHISQYHT